jgi:hypothetical protein
VESEIRLHFPMITDIAEQTISFIDPAGLKKSETNEQTYMHYIVKGGFKNVRPGPITWERRKEAVDSFLVGLSKGEGRLQIYEKGCPVLTAGFKGGFRYADSVSQAEPDKIRPIKDIHSHPHDGLQYLCGGLKAYVSDRYNFDIPAPAYSFQKTESLTPQPRKIYG